MQYNEAELKKVLGIDTWRNLSKDKVVEFLALMPERGSKVTLAAIGQLPEFMKFTRAAVEDATKAFDSVIAANEHGQQRMQDIHLRQLAILEAELNKDLTAEERQRVLNDIRDVGEKARAEDAESRNVLAGMFTTKLLFGLGMAVATLVFVGARVGLKAGGDGARAPRG